MHDMVSGAPQDERRRSCSERGGGKGKCQRALKPQSPRRLPGLNHLRSSLTSGIDRHAWYDLVPPPPPPHLLPIYLNFNGFFISCFQLNSLALVILNKSSLLSLFRKHTHTHTHSIYIYIPTRSTDSLFALAVFLDVRHRSLDDPPTSKYFDRSCLQTTSLKRMFWAFV